MISDLGTFLVGKVYHLAAYATALTHSLQPICRDASCSRHGGTRLAAAPMWHGAGLPECPVPCHPRTARPGEENATMEAEAAKLT